MLRRLTINAFALIEHIDLEFDKGLTVLLGETGAGKSIIIDALSIALGQRCSSEVVRTGSKKSVVEATFSDVPPEVRVLLDRHDLQWEFDELVMRREISAAGTSRCFINDTPTQLPAVREIAALLIDFHGQHDTHGLLSTSSHRDILDRYTSSAEQLRIEMKQHWDNYQNSARQLQDMQDRARNADADRVRLSFLKDEILAIDPFPNEDHEIAQELRRAEAHEHVYGLAANVRDALYASERSAYDVIRESRDRLKELQTYDQSLESAVTDLETALIACKEVAGSIAHLADPDSNSPERLEYLRQRSVQLQRIVRKYGTLEEAIATSERLAQDLGQLETLDDDIASVQQAVEAAHSRAKQTASKLRNARLKGAATFAESVEAGVKLMGMSSTRFSIVVDEHALGPTGSDTVEFLVSSNPGDPPRPINKIASGGELSRIMLSVKRSLSAGSMYGTMMFDEIDTGISGRIARTVGDVMKSLSASHQIIAITHLPQIASLADCFIRVSKSSGEQSTVVTACSIDQNEALIEVAKLISGEDVSDVSISGARELMTSKRRSTSK